MNEQTIVAQARKVAAAYQRFENAKAQATRQTRGAALERELRELERVLR